VVQSPPKALRESRFFIGLIPMYLLLILASVPDDVMGQTASSAPKPKPAVKTSTLLGADGKPDLQGIWDFGTITPMERPLEHAGKEFLTEQEAADWARKRLDEVNFDRRDGGGAANISRGYNEYWVERGQIVKTRRTSLVIDPPDGKIPLTDVARQRQRESRARYLTEDFNGPEDLSLAQRCLKLQGGGPPLHPTLYNNNVRIQQGPGYLMIQHEMAGVRVIPLDGRPHLPEQIRLWNGDSRGHWEGDTLVVETTNFNTQYEYLGGTAKTRLTERFRRVDKDTLLYQFTIEDPSAFVRPWTAEIPARKTEGPLLEYACHEGNFTLSNALSAARAKDRAAQSSEKK
jgi:hypothetical protein